MNHFNITLIITLIALSQSNIWDNIYSHLYSNPPSISLPPSFVVHLIDLEDNNVTGDITVSSDLNKVRISVSNLIIPYNDEIVVIDFTEGVIYKDGSVGCQKYYDPDLSQISVEFLLKSYDLFTYFEEKGSYYHYVISNPRGSNYKGNKEKGNVYNKIDELPVYVRLKVTKKDHQLKEIDYKMNTSIKKQGKMSATVKTDIPISEEDFKILNEDDCSEVSTTSSNDSN